MCASSPLGAAGLRRLMPSGYVSVGLPPFFLVCDVAPIGPDHLPAHAHADTLSFEMSFMGRRVFVNSGTSEYGTGRRAPAAARHGGAQYAGARWREFERSLGGISCRATRAGALCWMRSADESGITIAGEHDGYRRLPGRNVHRRSWTLERRASCWIEDTVEGRFRSAECYFHLHPEIHVRRGAEPDLRWVIRRGVMLDVMFEGAAGVDVVDSSWHPRVRRLAANRCMVARLEGSRLTIRIRAERVGLRLLDPQFLFPAGLECRFVSRERAGRCIARIDCPPALDRRHHHSAESVQHVHARGRGARDRGAAHDKANRPAGASQRPVGSIARLPALRALRQPLSPRKVITMSVIRNVIASHDGCARRMDRAARARAALLDIRDIFVDTIGDVFPKIAACCGRPCRRWSGGPCAARIASIWCRAGFEEIFSRRATRIAHTPGSPTESMRSFCARTGRSRNIGRRRFAAAGAVCRQHRRGPRAACHSAATCRGGWEGACISGDRRRRAPRAAARAAAESGGATMWTSLHPCRAPRCSLLTQSADILFLHLNAHAAFEKVLPSKIFEYAATGKPIWAGVAGYAARFIAAEVPNAAVFAPCNAAEAIEKLDSLTFEDQPRREFVSRYARRDIAGAMAEDILQLARGRTRHDRY